MTDFDRPQDTEYDNAQFQKAFEAGERAEARADANAFREVHRFKVGDPVIWCGKHKGEIIQVLELDTPLGRIYSTSYDVRYLIREDAPEFGTGVAIGLRAEDLRLAE